MHFGEKTHYHISLAIRWGFPFQNKKSKDLDPLVRWNCFGRKATLFIAELP